MKTDCIKAVQEAIGRSLTQAEAQGIEGRVKKALADLAREDRERFLGLSTDARLIEAGARAADELVHEAQVKKVRTALTIKAHDRILSYINEAGARKIDALDALNRTLAFVADGKSGFMSAEIRSEAVKRNALRQLLDTFEAGDPKLFGLFENREGTPALTRELFGVDSCEPLAKKGAEAWLQVAEQLRRQFNAA